MKKSVFVCFLMLASIFGLNAQKKTSEFGVFIGRSYYLGEVNPNKHFGNDIGSLAYGLSFRYNLNKRYSLRSTLVKTKLRGKDELSSIEFNQLRLNEFTTNLTELSARIEFNFLPYAVGDPKHFFSPYLFVGAAYYSYNPTATLNGVEIGNEATEAGNGMAAPLWARN